jgi:hypothetical protein
MLTSDPYYVLAQVREHNRNLRAEAAAERFRATSGTRRALAVYLRRAADRLDPSPVVPKAAAR